MGKVTTAAGIITSVIVGAVTWFVLDVILGVAVWISFVAGGGVLLLGVLLAVGAGTARPTAGPHRSGPSSPLGAR